LLWILIYTLAAMETSVMKKCVLRRAAMATDSTAVEEEEAAAEQNT
jgi:hypothetical protein